MAAGLHPWWWGGVVLAPVVQLEAGLRLSDDSVICGGHVRVVVSKTLPWVARAGIAGLFEPPCLKPKLPARVFAGHAVRPGLVIL